MYQSHYEHVPSQLVASKQNEVGSVSKADQRFRPAVMSRPKKIRGAHILRASFFSGFPSLQHEPSSFQFGNRVAELPRAVSIKRQVGSFTFW
jgi:hypothetical protein